MKNLVSILALFLVLIATSCKQEKENELLKHIPADAAFVARINTQALIKKSGIRLDNGKVKLPVENANPDIVKDIETIAQCGIDFKKDIYMFSLSYDMPVAILAHVSIDKFEKFANDNHFQFGKTQNGIRSYCGMNMKAYVKGDILMLTTDQRQNEKTDAVAIGVLSSDNNWTDSELPTILSSDDDAVAFVDIPKTTALISKMGISDGYPFFNVFGEVLNDMYKSSVYHLNIIDNTLSVRMENKLNKDSKYVKYASLILQKQNDDFLSYIPKNVNALASISINGKALTEVPEVQSLMSQTDGLGLSSVLINDVISSINGTVAFAMSAQPTDINMELLVSCENPTLVLNRIVNETLKDYAQEENGSYLIPGFGKLYADDKHIYFVSQDYEISEMGVPGSGFVQDVKGSLKYGYYDWGALSHRLQMSAYVVSRTESLEKSELRFYCKYGANNFIASLLNLSGF